MKTLRDIHLILFQLFLMSGFAVLSQPAFGQTQAINGATSSGTPGRPVTIPVTIKVNEKTEVAELQNIDLTISEDGVPIMDATIRTSRLALPLPAPSAGRTWARAEDGPNAGSLLRGKTTMRFHGLRIGRGRGTSITWGEHRMADRARALGMDQRPFATFSAERLDARFGESEVVDG